jgi:hypothetical protein
MDPSYLTFQQFTSDDASKISAANYTGGLAAVAYAAISSFLNLKILILPKSPPCSKRASNIFHKIESSVENCDDEDQSEASKAMCSGHRANHDFVRSSSSQTVHQG